jgi:hypothetical protein
MAADRGLSTQVHSRYTLNKKTGEYVSEGFSFEFDSFFE